MPISLQEAEERRTNPNLVHIMQSTRATAGPQKSMSQTFITEPQRNTPVKAETQVLVVGGGSAGVSAAVAAARNGAEVILVERLGYLGGLATGGLIALLLTLDDGRGR